MEPLFKNTSKINEEELTKYQLKLLKKTIILFAAVVILISLGAGIPILIFVNEFVGGAIIVLGALGGAVLLPYLLKDSVKKQNAKVLGDRKYLNTLVIILPDTLTAILETVKTNTYATVHKIK